MSTSPTIVITGPTATGKTELSLVLARHLETPVISADARQCYKYMDIGTGKVSDEVLQEIPHHHISALYPDEPFTTSDFYEKYREWIAPLQAEGKPILVVGGSTLYIESLIRPLDPLPSRNQDNLETLQRIAEQKGLQAIREQLEEVDPVYARRIDGLNTHRMFRALDVWMQTGRPFSSFHSNRPVTVPEDMLLVCLYRDRNELHRRINRRVDRMMDEGLVHEVQGILDMGYDPGLQSLQTVGYRETIAHFRGELTMEELREKIKTHTRRYARRQLTWFRRWNRVNWLLQTGQTEKIIAGKVLKMTAQLAAED
ncbi:MAG: tRNA (adenosine(37)-N6)-dimethylallyltransferase MiaA [Cyclonatronaceae bacterium]